MNDDKRFWYLLSVALGLGPELGVQKGTARLKSRQWFSAKAVSPGGTVMGMHNSFVRPQQFANVFWMFVSIKSWQRNCANIGNRWFTVLGASWSTWIVLLTSRAFGSWFPVLHLIESGLGGFQTPILVPLIGPPLPFLFWGYSKSSSLLSYSKAWLLRPVGDIKLALVTKISLMHTGKSLRNDWSLFARVGVLMLLHRPPPIGANTELASSAVQGGTGLLQTSSMRNLSLLRI